MSECPGVQALLGGGSCLVVGQKVPKMDFSELLVPKASEEP